MEFMDLLSLKDILLTKKVLPEPAIACISNKVGPCEGFPRSHGGDQTSEVALVMECAWD